MEAKSNTWIVDTRATNHIVCDSSLFLASEPILKAFVSLPNGHKVQVLLLGLLINPYFILHNVLYILEFAFNLLSVSKLIHTHQVCLVFITDHYYVQALSK